MTPERILVVEDEPAIAQAVEYALEAEGFHVDAIDDGAEALAAARDLDYDLLVLDLMLPGLSGVEICRRLRLDSAVPIVMLTAKDAELDRVLGLEIGADDYVTKPFSMAELVARIRALLRRRELDSREGGVRLRVGDLEIDLAKHQAYVGDERACDLHISNIRRKLERDPANPERLVTVRGAGYKLQPV